MNLRGNSRIANLLCGGALVALLGSGCASVQQEQMYTGRLPRPEQIIVFDFAVSPDEVKVDSGLSARAVRGVKGESTQERQQSDAQKVVDLFSQKLVKEISDMGLPVVRESQPAVGGAAVHLLVQGSFVSVDEGDRGERIAIGLGVGKSKVVVDVELVDWTPEGQRTVDRFEVTAKSGYNPGAAETMGAGAIAGHLLVSTAVTAGVQTASETFGSNIEADTGRAAKNAAKMMKKFFVREGWIDE